jgi:hypothetical protein
MGFILDVGLYWQGCIYGLHKLKNKPIAGGLKAKAEFYD